MDRKKYINGKIKALSKHVDKLEESKQAIAKDLIENLAFQTCALTELRELIIEDGFTEEYQNGANQFGTKQSSNVATYNKIMTTYNQTAKNFVGLFAKDEKEELRKDLEFGQFIAKSKATRR